MLAPGREQDYAGVVTPGDETGMADPGDRGANDGSRPPGVDAIMRVWPIVHGRRRRVLLK